MWNVRAAKVDMIILFIQLNIIIKIEGCSKVRPRFCYNHFRLNSRKDLQTTS